MRLSSQTDSPRAVVNRHSCSAVTERVYIGIWGRETTEERVSARAMGGGA
jgi:hypothetical protein